MNHAMNSNINSMNTSGNTSGSHNGLIMALERLSSALRINKITETTEERKTPAVFRKQPNDVDQAIRNANDGVSLTQTAESALSGVQNSLQRARALAVQSIKTHSVSTRAALSHEIRLCMANIDRIASHTYFKSLPLLNGTFGTLTFQVGATTSETITVSLTIGVHTNQIGQIATSTGSPVTSRALSAGCVAISVGTGQAVVIGASIAGTGIGQMADSAYAKAQIINRANIPTLTATASTTVTGTFTTTSAIAGNTYGLILNGVAVFNNYDLSIQGALTGSAIVNQINLYSSQTGVSASCNSETDQITLIAADGRNIMIEQATRGATTGGFAEDVVGQNPGGAIHRGSISLSSAENIVLTGNHTDLGFTQDIIAKDTKTLTDVSITTAAMTKEALDRIDASLSTISHLRTYLGAVRSRFQSTIANLQAVSQNLSGSRGHMLDPNFALETAAMIRSQISQQTNISLLTQANSTPQTVLKLLS